MSEQSLIDNLEVLTLSLLLRKAPRMQSYWALERQHILKPNVQ